MPDDVYKVIGGLMIKSRMTVVLTGAGISTESGIPDFRSPGTGLWSNTDPMEVLSRDVLYKNPVKFYNEGFKLLVAMTRAKPNTAHFILAKMESEKLVHCIITQNIDNLHYQAGSKHIMEVHGHLRTAHCIKCKGIYGFEELLAKVDNGEIPPLCNCGGMLRPDVVLFGDNLPHCINDAWDMAGKCDLMIVIGSSLQVAPVSNLPGLAKRLVIINIGDTSYDEKADILCREKASTALDKIYYSIQKIKESGL